MGIGVFCTELLHQQQQHLSSLALLRHLHIEINPPYIRSKDACCIGSLDVFSHGLSVADVLLSFMVKSTVVVS